MPTLTELPARWREEAAFMAREAADPRACGDEEEAAVSNEARSVFLQCARELERTLNNV